MHKTGVVLKLNGLGKRTCAEEIRINTIREINKTDHKEIIKLTEMLSEWFDEDARLRAIPSDLGHQSGFIC